MLAMCANPRFVCWNAGYPAIGGRSVLGRSPVENVRWVEASEKDRSLV
jgi:hypothetical protein